MSRFISVVMPLLFAKARGPLAVLVESQFQLLRAKRFGPSSEILSPEQTLLFTEADVEAIHALEAQPAVVVVPASALKGDAGMTPPRDRA